MSDIAWFKVDDGFHDHPKVDNLSLEAIGLWLVCATWSSRHLTDGVVPFSRIVKLGGTRELCSELVRANMWRTSGDVRDEGSANEYEYINWDDWNPTKQDVQEERRKARERMQKLRGKQPEQGKRSPERTPNEQGTSGDVRDPVPSRPVPSNTAAAEHERFAEFYSIYPRPVARKAASQKFSKAIKDGADPQAIIDGAKTYAEVTKGTEKRFIAHPTTWLNQGRWEDTHELPATGTEGAPTIWDNIQRRQPKKP